jgi:hypothetical protein
MGEASGHVANNEPKSLCHLVATIHKLRSPGVSLRGDPLALQ